MRSGRGSCLQCGFESDRARKQDVVLQVDVLVQILFELLQAAVEGEVGWARTERGPAADRT